MNTWKYTASMSNWANLRGATGVFFGNRVQAVGLTWTALPIHVTRGIPPAGSPVFGLLCDGTAGKFCLWGSPTKSCFSNSDCNNSRPCVNVDTGDSGYPCRDQMGRGKTDSVTGVMALEPFNFWDNKICYGAGGVCDPESGSALVPDSQTPAQLQSGRDYCVNTSKPDKCNGVIFNYTPFTYPHPLRTDCVTYPALCDTDTTPPASPTGLGVQ